MPKKENETFLCLLLYFSLLRSYFLKESLSQLFLQLLIVLGLSLHVSNFWLLLGFLPVPFSSSPLEKKYLSFAS